MAREQRQVILYKQLIGLAHTAGLTNILTELIQLPHEANGGIAVFKATVILEQEGVTKTFTAYGDAAKNNVAQAMIHCLPRMAETRAKARALRDAVNVGAVAAEELPDYEEGAASAGRYVAPKAEPTPNAPITEAQTEAIRSLCRRRNAEPDALAQERFHLPVANLTQAQASDLIRSLNQKQAA